MWKCHNERGSSASKPSAEGGGEAKYSHVKRVPQAFVVYQNNHGFISRDTEYLFNKIDCTYSTYDEVTGTMQY